MSPFDLPGPQFLIFYVVVIVVVVLTVLTLRAQLEDGSAPYLGEVDPYLVAYLRGGEDEAIRVAVFALLDRGLLDVEGDDLRAKPGAVARVRRLLERSILEGCATKRSRSTIFTHPETRQACADLDAQLRQLRLLPNRAQQNGRWLLLGSALAIGWIVAGIKIATAIERGRSNVGFLILLALALPVILYVSLRSRTTRLGDRFLEDLQRLFGRLRFRSAQILTGGATNELALLAGVYGFSALSGEAQAKAYKAFPMRREKAESGSSCGTTTSCGSSGGSSCGSSCGGGGGGGGCGGCGS